MQSALEWQDSPGQLRGEAGGEVHWNEDKGLF